MIVSASRTDLIFLFFIETSRPLGTNGSVSVTSKKVDVRDQIQKIHQSPVDNPVSIMQNDINAPARVEQEMFPSELKGGYPHE